MRGHKRPALRATVRTLSTMRLALAWRRLRLSGSIDTNTDGRACNTIMRGLPSTLTTGPPAPLALSRFGVTLRMASGCGICAGIGIMKLRRNRRVTGLTVTPALATTGTLGIPFFHRRRP